MRLGLAGQALGLRRVPGFACQQVRVGFVCLILEPAPGWVLWRGRLREGL